MAKKRETNATKASVGVADSIFKGSAKNAPKVKADYLGVNKKPTASGGRGKNNASIGPKKSGGMGGPNAKIGKKEPHPGRYEEAYAENAIGGRKLAGGIKGVSKAPKTPAKVSSSLNKKKPLDVFKLSHKEQQGWDPKTGKMLSEITTYPKAKKANFKPSTPKSIPKNQGTKTPATTVRKPGSSTTFTPSIKLSPHGKAQTIRDANPIRKMNTGTASKELQKIENKSPSASRSRYRLADSAARKTQLFGDRHKR